MMKAYFSGEQIRGNIYWLSWFPGKSRDFSSPYSFLMSAFVQAYVCEDVLFMNGDDLLRHYVPRVDISVQKQLGNAYDSQKLEDLDRLENRRVYKQQYAPFLTDGEEAEIRAKYNVVSEANLDDQFHNIL